MVMNKRELLKSGGGKGFEGVLRVIVVLESRLFVIGIKAVSNSRGVV